MEFSNSGANKSETKRSHQPDAKHILDPKRVLQILEWRRKILAFIETMMETGITLEQLKTGEGLICRRDYDCIVQERHLTKLCGYPPCSETLTREWKQRYHVSLRDKRIYDVEVRKLYCSPTCMDTSSKYRNENLPEEPVWMTIGKIDIDPNFETQMSNP